MRSSKERLGHTIRDARQGAGLSIRELGRRTGVSAAQLSRIEAGHVTQPSIDTLVRIATAVGRNPKLLLIVSGHISGREALSVLRPMFSEGLESDADSVAGWFLSWEEEFGSTDLQDARALLSESDPSESRLRELASSVFATAHLNEVDVWDSFLAPLIAASFGEEFHEFLMALNLLSRERRAKVTEYLEEQTRLDKLDWAETDREAEAEGEDEDA